MNVNWPALPRTVKTRMLDELVTVGYTYAAAEMKTIHIIGGELGGLRFLESYLHKKDLDYQLFAKGDLCVVMKTLDRVSYSCLNLKSDAAKALFILPTAAITVRIIKLGVCIAKAWARSHH